LLKQQFSLKLQAKMGQLKDVAAIKKVRRDIARVNTVLAEVLKASNKEGK
jgi:ribosomal protein L29